MFEKRARNLILNVLNLLVSNNKLISFTAEVPHSSFVLSQLEFSFVFKDSKTFFKIEPYSELARIYFICKANRF